MSSKNEFKLVKRRVLMFMAWRNLTHKKMRSFLTLFGIVIGIGGIYFLISLGLGIQQLVTDRVVGGESVKSIDVTTANEKNISLDSDTYTKLKNLPHVIGIGGMYSFAGLVNLRGSSVDVVVYGANDSYLKMLDLKLLSGSLIKTGSDNDILINQSVLRSLDYKKPEDAIGKKITLIIPSLGVEEVQFKKEFTIVGVSADQSGAELYVASDILMAAGAENFNQIRIEASDVDGARSLRSQIKALGLTTASPIDTVDQIDQVFKFFNLILASFGAIGMIVAILGMFNTITISLLERTREIGLMVALGGRDTDMRMLIVFEAMLLSFIGSILGILSATIFGQLINLGLNLFARSRGVTEGFQLFATTWWLVLGTIGFMMLVGLVVVFIPARQAARLNPIDALRRE